MTYRSIKRCDKNIMKFGSEKDKRGKSLRQSNLNTEYTFAVRFFEGQKRVNDWEVI